jgi:predicted anti-sigma-YlaC factor YlaD
MDCKDIDMLLTAYLEGMASPEEQEQVQEHLATCSRCREEMEVRQTSRNRLIQSLRLTASRVTPPADAWESIAEQAGIKSRDGKDRKSVV